MDFGELHDRLVAQGYSDDTADAKIAHDIVLKAVRDSGFHDNITVKGGVVMSGITDVVRRATMDLDLDFMHYPLTNVAIRRFVAGLNRVAPCKIRIRGGILNLQQQEYKGKRVYLHLVDAGRHQIDTKLDIGVHTHAEMMQADFPFKVITDTGTVLLLVNSVEQIFVEKLKSLLRLGSISTRYKDLFDLCYLTDRASKQTVGDFLKLYVFGDKKMRERRMADIVRRLQRIFSSKQFMRGLRNPSHAWLSVSPTDATDKILAYISSLRDVE